MKTRYRYTVTTIIGVLMTLMVLSTKGTFAKSDTLQIYRDLSDAFFVPGAFILLFGLFTVVSNEHVFDLVIYGTKAAVNIFRKPENRTLSGTYIDYRLKKDERKKASLKFLFVVGLVFIAIAFIFLLKFNSMYIEP